MCFPPAIDRGKLPAVTRVLLLAAALTAALLHAPAWGASADARASMVRSFYNRWRGTPYRWGGTSRSGIDCSAYVRQMYRDLFKVELPRTTKQQIRVGVPIRLNPQALEDGLNPGDVIFYVNRTGIPNHVVSYAGRGLITHSVSGRGVVMEPIAKIYGRRVTARRYLVPPSQGSRSVVGPFSDDGPGGGAAIEPLDPAEIQDIPCPDSYRARPDEVRKYLEEPVQPDLPQLADRDLCEVRALAAALARRGPAAGPLGPLNAAALEEFARWLEDIDSLEATLKGLP